MKYTFAALLFLLAMPFVTHAQSSNKFTINGKVTNLKEGYVYLRYLNKEGKSVYDSCALKNGTFQFTGSVAEPVMASLSGKMNSRSVDDPNFTAIFIEPTAMKVTVADQAFKSAVVTGSISQTEYAMLLKPKLKIQKRWASIMDTLHEVNKRSNFEYQEMKNWVLVPYYAEMEELDAEFIRTHRSSYVTAYLARFGRGFTDDSLQKVYAAFPAKIKQSSFGKAIIEELNKRRIGVPGAMAASFSAKDINGQELSLADLKGKYVLLDFWASWCVPCRKGNPHLKELYAQYKEKGFEIVGVSDDDSKPDAWKTAVAKDDLPWKHVLRGMKVTRNGDNVSFDRSKDISDLYNVSSLPTQVLINPEGKIIGRYGEGGDEHTLLDEKLQSVFK